MRSSLGHFGAVLVIPASGGLPVTAEGQGADGRRNVTGVRRSRDATGTKSPCRASCRLYSEAAPAVINGVRVGEVIVIYLRYINPS